MDRGSSRRRFLAWASVNASVGAFAGGCAAVPSPAPAAGSRRPSIATRAGSRRLAPLSDGDRVAALLADVERVHPGLRDHFVAGASKCWDADPFQRGAYAYFKPGQMIGVAPHLGRAEGRLHFAGDHTSHRPGFMHGALASAHRVLAEIADPGS